MRILVTGAAGLLGGRLAEILAARFDVVAAFHEARVPSSLASVDLDVTSAASVEAAIERSRPDGVLHAAALANAETCQRDPERATRINAGGSERLASACRRHGLRLVKISTDLVFDGLHSLRREGDEASPLQAYGRTKLEGENAVLASGASAVVARIALVVGRGFGLRGSATESIAWSLRAGRPVALFTDEYRTPVDAESAAAALAALLEGTQVGRFHIGGPERLSRYELGLRVAAQLGLPTLRIEAVRQSDRPTPAARPADVSLDSGRAIEELGYRPRTVEDAIGEGRAAAES